MLALVCGLSSLLLVPAPVQGAGPDEAIRAEATNLSRSGAASDATVVVAPDGTVQVFWWDAFDGLTTALYDGESWSEPQLASIYIPVIKQEETLYRATTAMPFIADDAAGRAHALWVGPERIDQTAGSAGEVDTVPPLLHSRLDVGSNRWSGAQRVADGATAWTLASAPDGTVHILYFMSKQSEGVVAGAYHRRSSDGGASWSQPVLLQESLYVRRATPETALLRLVADGGAGVHATWSDAATGRMLYARSADGGATWDEPVDLGAALGAAGDSYLGASSGGLLLLWDTDPLQARGRLYQKVSADSGATWGPALRTMPDALVSLNRMSFGSLPDGRMLAVLADPDRGLGLAAWDATTIAEALPTGWSQFRTVQMTGAAASVVGKWSLVVREGEVVLVGQGVDAEVWAMRLPLSGITWQYTPGLLRMWGQSLGAASGETGSWSAPLNLSRSGSASLPVVVAGPQGAWQAFWWDQFDGLMSAYAAGDTWYGPKPAPILIEALVRDETVAVPLAQMPTILGDDQGRAHAWWLAPGEGEEGGTLMHASLELGDTRWAAPQAVAKGIVAWSAFLAQGGGTHALIVRALETAELPAGVYHVAVGSTDQTETVMHLIYPSLFYRTAAPDTLYVSGAADGRGYIVAAWTGPQQQGVLWSRSFDSGQSWSEPLGAPAEGMTAPVLAAMGRGHWLALWQAAQSGQGATYQQLSDDGGATWSDPARVLSDLSLGRDAMRITHDQSLGTLLIAGGTSLARWDAEQADLPEGGWSQPVTLYPELQEPESGRALYLSSQAAAVRDGRVTLVGQDQGADIWVTGRAVDNAWLYAPSPVWSGPTEIGAALGAADVPAVALDGDGQMHAIWSERDAQGNPGNRLYYASGEESLTGTSAYVIEALDGKAEQPSMVLLGDRLHLVWSGGANGQTYCSRSFVRDAGSRSGWYEPTALPEPEGAGGLGSWPRIQADRTGLLHVIYAVPANEARGIYYTRSTDGGLTWQPALPVCDAVAEGWASVDRPALAVGADGTLHAAWLLTTLSANAAPEAIYYARSADGGETWSAPLGVAFGPYTSPMISVSPQGEIDLLWRDLSREGVWTHLRSPDGSQWRIAGQPQGFRDIVGQAALVSDGLGTLHLLGLARDEAGAPVLRYTVWQAGATGWAAQVDHPLGMRYEPVGGLGAALQPETGVLAVAGVARLASAEEERFALLGLRRSVQPVELPQLRAIAEATPDATPSPEPTATPRPTPTVPSGAPAPSAAVGVGPLTLPYTGLAGLALVALLVSAVVISFRLRSASRYHR
jgi:hypothetical protein